MSQTYARIHSTTFMVKLQYEISSKPFTSFGPVLPGVDQYLYIVRKIAKMVILEQSALIWIDRFTPEVAFHTVYRSHVPMSD